MSSTRILWSFKQSNLVWENEDWLYFEFNSLVKFFKSVSKFYKDQSFVCYLIYEKRLVQWLKNLQNYITKKKDFNFLYKVQRVRCLLIWNNWLVKQHRPKQKVLYPVHACCTITAKSSITFMNIVFFLSCQIFLGQKLYMLLKGKTKKKILVCH